MRPCGFCDGPRINGMPIRKTEDGWEFSSGDDIHATFACRSCAKEKLEEAC